MMGISDIDISISSLYNAWCRYKKGKKKSKELDDFSYNLYDNLANLANILKNGSYKHSLYKSFVVRDNKERLVHVASISDKIVHRLVYDYLVGVYEKDFVYNVWSGRSDKGLHKCIHKVLSNTKKFPDTWVWRADISKFFESIDHNTLVKNIKVKVGESSIIFYLCREVINSFSSHKDSGGLLKGIPIGNLTSQIFANIYLHDFDKFVLNILKPIFYCRYGDDFLLFIKSKSEILNVQMRGIYFIKKVLKLSIQIKNNITFKVKWGIRFCGFVIYPKGFILGNRIKNRILDRINYNNISSYVALIKFGLPKRYTLRFYHHMDNLIDF